MTKLGVDLAIGVGLALATLAAARRDADWLTEVLIVIYYGYTLASLALVGQVYQSGAPTYHALLAWTAATIPLVLLARSRAVAAVVAAGWAWTHGATFLEFGQWIEDHFDEPTTVNVMLTTGVASQLAWLGAAHLFGATRSAWRSVLGGCAVVAIASGAFGVCLAWYDATEGLDRPTWGLATCLGLTAAAIALLPASLRRPIGGTVALQWLLVAGSTSLPRDAHPAVGALLQILCLAWFAFAALDLGRVSLFHLCTALVAVRVLVAYFEVFGSMLDTGLGMISGGTLTLLMAWIWRRRTTAWAAEWAHRQEARRDA